MNENLQPPPQLPVAWVFFLSAAIILAAIAAVLLWLTSASPVTQYPIILALLCFVLSTISGLLFASRTDIRATLPIAAITLGGPAITWLGTLLIVSYIFPAPTLTPEHVVDVLRAQYLRQGWKTFPEWINELGPLRSLILRDEANNVREALDTAYYVGTDRVKLTDPSLQILYVYSTNNTAMKIERVTGIKGNFAEIFFRGSTTQSGSARSIFLEKNDDMISFGDLGSESDWENVRTDESNLDCLMITLYPEGMLSEGDLIYIDTNKYRQKGLAKIEVGILAPQKIGQPNVWHVANFPFPLPDEVPVIYKRSPTVWDSNVEQIISDLGSWMTAIDRTIPGKLNTEASNFLEAAKGQLPTSSFASFYTAPIYRSKYSAHLDPSADAIAITLVQK